MDQIRHRILGTSLIKIDDFIKNVKDCAGTCFSITITDYTKQEDRLCSYSFINKYFHLTWNDILKKAGLQQQKIFRIKTQGRKPINKSKYEKVQCLKCLNFFESWDKKYNRICKKCKNIARQRGENYGG